MLKTASVYKLYILNDKEKLSASACIILLSNWPRINDQLKSNSSLIPDGLIGILISYTKYCVNCIFF